MSSGRADHRRTLALCGALVVAAVAVVLWNGSPRMLDPTRVDWVAADDPLAHVMGWEQFRTSPLLQYPITKNESYGLERGSSLVYSDSIPIVALVLRPLSPILPHPFQYLGWYAVLAVALQGYWGARLIRLRSDRLSHAVLGAGFFMVAPTLLNRIGIHTALTSQWMLLCALWLYFSSREAQARRWAALLLLAISVHAYLFVMVAAIWAASLAKCAIARTLRRRDLLHAGAILVAIAAWMHCLGYFVVGKGAAAGGATTRFDLVNFVAGMSWNTLLPVVYGNPEPNAWDGYAYLGAGLMALLVLGAGFALAARLRRRGAPAAAALPGPATAGHVEVSWAPLIAVAMGFLVFAVSERVLFNGQPILSYHWPKLLRPITATFRGGGRMIWPTYYVLVVSILWFVIRGLPRRAVAWLLAAGLAVQLIDFRGGARLMRVSMSGPGLVEPLRDPVWGVIEARYSKLVSIPAWHGQPDRHTLGWFSAVHGIASNIGYFGRMSALRQEQGARQELDEALNGHYDPTTVYSFPYPETWNIAKLSASPRDLLIVADGHHLLVPGGNPGGTARPGGDAVSPPLDTWLPFSAGGTAGGFLLDGWSWRESWGTWSDAKATSLAMPVPRAYRGKLRITLRWLAHMMAGRRQNVHVTFDRSEFQVWFDHDLEHREDTFDVVVERDWIPVRMQIQRPVPEVDGRLLGVGVIAIRMSNPDAPAPAVIDPGAAP